MSYQQFLRATSNPVQNVSPVSPPASLHRKPVTSSVRSDSPVNGSISSTPVYGQNLSPLSSFPPPPLSNRASRPPGPLSHHPPNASTIETVAPSPELGSLTNQEVDAALQACLRIQQTAVSDHGKQPFAALLLGPDNSTVLNTQFSISHFQHAESELARLAATQYSQSWLAKCTIVSTWEPCAMCSSTIYWAGIGRLLYAASETKLKELTGVGNKKNMTLDLPCRIVFAAGQRNVEVVGPIGEWEQKVVDESWKWWKDHQESTGIQYHKSGVGNNSIDARSVSIYNPDESMLGSLDEEGEYQADLRIDWMT